MLIKSPKARKRTGQEMIFTDQGGGVRKHLRRMKFVVVEGIRGLRRWRQGIGDQAGHNRSSDEVELSGYRLGLLEFIQTHLCVKRTKVDRVAIRVSLAAL
jgi:hypothetical protein